MIDPILIDECLSPRLAGVARARGLVATHISWLNLQGAADWNVADLATEQNYVVVTNNRRDFLRLYAKLEVHSGLIIVVPKVRRQEQMRLFGIALDVAEQQESLINLLIEVDADGTVEVRNWAASGSEGTG